MNLPLRLAAVMITVASMHMGAQDWSTAEKLPGIDLSGLSSQAKVKVLKILREAGCSCGCDMKLAECRVKDPGCGYSTSLAAEVIASVKAGKSESETLAALKNSQWSHLQEPKLLDAAVDISSYGAPSRGPANAPVTLVEFSDFQCPYCAVAIGQIDDILKTYPNNVRLVFKQFPLETHPQAALAAAAALAANKQGKFWAMHDALFANRNNLSRPAILEVAKQIGLDLNRFQRDWDSTEVREAVVRDVQDGDRAHVEGTPTIFVNGQRFNGQITAETLGPIINDELKSQGAKAVTASR